MFMHCMMSDWQNAFNTIVYFQANSRIKENTILKVMVLQSTPLLAKYILNFFTIVVVAACQLLWTCLYNWIVCYKTLVLFMVCANGSINQTNALCLYIQDKNQQNLGPFSDLRLLVRSKPKRSVVLTFRVSVNINQRTLVRKKPVIYLAEEVVLVRF